MTLDELSDAWNELRNAALGRGTKPAVPATLAERVGARYEAWRVWLGNAAPVDDVLASVSASKWVREYRSLLAAVERAGVRPSSMLPLTGIETAQRVARKLDRAFAFGLVGLGVTTLLFFASRGNGRA